MARILIVEDSPVQLLAMRKIVERLGHEVLVAGDGAQALILAKAQQPDMILMDVVMPLVNGFQATRSLVRDPETSHIPIAIVTTKDQETDRAWGLRQGAKEYLPKPFTDQQLTAVIEKMLTTKASTAA